MIGWTALILAAVALARTIRRSPGWQAGRKLDRMANKVEPIDLATPEQFGVVTHGGPPGGRVLVQRHGALINEEMTAATYLNHGQRVRITTSGGSASDIAYPLLPEE